MLLSKVLSIGINLGSAIVKYDNTFFRKSGGTPSGNLATIFMASFHCTYPGSPPVGSKLNRIRVSWPKIQMIVYQPIEEI